MTDRLLLALDDADGTLDVAAGAIDLAAALDAALDVVYVLDLRPVYSRYGLATLPTEGQLERDERRARGVLDGVADRAADRGLGCTTAVKRGTAHVVVAEYAAEVDADAIVVRPPRASWLDRLFGETGLDRVIRDGPLPVYVVGEDGVERRPIGAGRD